MARDHIIQPVCFRPAKQVIELHISVAVDAGIGRTAGLVDPDEFVDDLFLKVCRKIQHLVGNIHRIGHLGGVLNVPPEQQVCRPSVFTASLRVRRMVTPVQSKPSLCMSHAATELSTPPLMAMTPRAAGSVLCFCHSVPLLL